MDKPEEGSEKGISRRPEEERKRERLEKREKLLYIKADYGVMGNTVPKEETIAGTAVLPAKNRTGSPVPVAERVVLSTS
ncbi:MAG: hypothetical protein J5493_08575 [Lachnospiraceae bacterium]|nr:hypothetical protein [Lachnospiraceae bacterium]